MTKLNAHGILFNLLFLIIWASGCNDTTVEIKKNVEGPNVVLIISDDQRYDALGIVQRELGPEARFPWLETPNLDKLASEGMRFTNAFVVSSLCSPSRAAILTGKYNHVNGIIDNNTEFEESTFVQVLKANGYETGFFGKWHMGSQKGPVNGFDIFKNYINQGDYYNCEFKSGRSFETLEGWVDDRTTDLAIDFLKTNAEGPFCCVIGFKSPHSPWNHPPLSVKGMYDNYRFKDSENLNSPPVYESNIYFTEEEYKSRYNTYDLKYFEIISAMDLKIGKIMDTLKELGIDEKTVVIFLSDNGLYLGEHGLRDKRSAYEESIRIPLIIRYPQLILSGSTNNKMILNLDIAPTILELTGVHFPDDIQGRSMMPLFIEKDPSWRDSFFYEYFEEPNYGPRISIFAVRKEDTKLIKYLGHEDWTELFDLKNDPYETRNLYYESNHKELLINMEDEFKKIAHETHFDYMLQYLFN